MKFTIGEKVIAKEILNGAVSWLNCHIVARYKPEGRLHTIWECQEVPPNDDNCFATDTIYKYTCKNRFKRFMKFLD